MSFRDLFRFYYRHAPRELIHIVFKGALYDPNGQSRWIIDEVLSPLLHQAEQQLDQSLPPGRNHRPEFARLTLHSLLVSPLLLQPVLERLSGQPMDEAYFEEWADCIGTLMDQAFGMA